MKSIIVWAIFDRPKDFPDCFVARKFTTTASGTKAGYEVWKSDTLEELQQKFEQEGLHRLPRMHDDVPHLVETWF